MKTTLDTKHRPLGKLNLFEFSSSKGMREIDSVVYRLDLGSESFANRKISKEKVDELCHVLNSFKNVMNTYKVTTISPHSGQ